MALNYFDLHNYWQCPRLWHYRRQYQGVAMKQDYLTGLWATQAVAAYWAGDDGWATVNSALAERVSELQAYGVTDHRIHKEATDAAKAAQARLQTYEMALGDKSTFHPLFVNEPFTLTSDGKSISVKPLAMGLLGGKLAVLGLRTEATDDVKALDHTGRIDFEAWAFGKVRGKAPDLVVIDVLTDDYTTRIVRPPRLEQGEYLAKQLWQLHRQVGLGASQPHFSSWCISCEFLDPCRFREVGGAEEEYLLQNYLPGAGSHENF